MDSQVSGDQTSNSGFAMPLQQQQQQHGMTCQTCFENGTECDICVFNQDVAPIFGCLECAQDGAFCHIPISDSAMIKQGFHTAIEGKRKCLNCVNRSRPCMFISGQRPDPCLSCIKRGATTCGLPPPPNLDPSMYVGTPSGPVSDGVNSGFFDMTSINSPTGTAYAGAGTEYFDYNSMYPEMNGEMTASTPGNAVPTPGMMAPTPVMAAPTPGMIVPTPRGWIDASCPEYHWIKAEGEFPPALEPVNSTETSDEHGDAVYTAEIPHSIDPYNDFAVEVKAEEMEDIDMASNTQEQIAPVADMGLLNTPWSPGELYYNPDVQSE